MLIGLDRDALELKIYNSGYNDHQHNHTEYKPEQTGLTHGAGQVGKGKLMGGRGGDTNILSACPLTFFFLPTCPPAHLPILSCCHLRIALADQDGDDEPHDNKAEVEHREMTGAEHQAGGKDIPGTDKERINRLFGLVFLLPGRG